MGPKFGGARLTCVDLIVSALVLRWLFAFATSPQGAALGSLLSGVAALLAVLVAGVGGYFGFKAWRRELRGTTEYHVARKVLQAIYRVRHGLMRTRAPGDPLDPRGRPLVVAESAHLFITRNLEVAYAHRINALAADRQELLVAEQEARALWGTPSVEALGRIHTLVTNLTSWAERFFESEHLRDVDDPPEPRGQEMERFHGLLYGQEPDRHWDQQIESAVKEAEDWYRPHLR